MSKRKHILRQVLYVEPIGLTRRGNPESWCSLLACGHIVYRYHSTRLLIHAFIYEQASSRGDPCPETRAQCHNCAARREPDWGKLSIRDLKILPQSIVARALDAWEHSGLHVDHLRAKLLKDTDD